MAKNIQVIDGTVNASFAVFTVDDAYFDTLFPNGADIAFLSDFPELQDDTFFWSQLNQNRLNKKTIQGIHGTLHLLNSPVDKVYFRNRMESDSRRYATYIEYDRTWLNSQIVKCVAKFAGTEVATVEVNLLADTITLVKGGFSLLPHDSVALLRKGETHEEQQLEYLKESVRRWADEQQNPQ